LKALGLTAARPCDVEGAIVFQSGATDEAIFAAIPTLRPALAEEAAELRANDPKLRDLPIDDLVLVSLLGDGKAAQAYQEAVEKGQDELYESGELDWQDGALVVTKDGEERIRRAAFTAASRHGLLPGWSHRPISCSSRRPLRSARRVRVVRRTRAHASRGSPRSTDDPPEPPLAALPAWGAAA
jgi:hypothetical protein